MIKANIYNKKMMVENHTVSDSVKFDTVEFTFPDDWNGYTKTAVFKSEKGEIFNVILDKSNPLCVNENECYIPHEVIKAPCFYLSVFGVKDESVATTTQEKVVVLESGYAEGEESKEPTPTEYQQCINLAVETKAIAESVRSDANNGLFKGEKGDKGEKGEKGDRGDKGDKGDKGETGEVSFDFASNAFASVIKNTLSGETLCVNDVSPVEHKLKVNIESKNLIPFPYSKGTETINGITFMHNGDGTITVNGTATANAVHYFFLNGTNPVVLLKGVYTLSGLPEGSTYETYYITMNFSLNGTNIDTSCYSSGISRELDGYKALGIVVKAGVTVNNLVFKPQLEKGTTATEYTPYAEVSAVKVSRYGKNLCQVNSVNYNESGKVLFEGNISGNFVLSWENNLEIGNKGGTVFEITYADGSVFTLSGWIFSSASSYIFQDKTITKIRYLNWTQNTGGSVDNIQLEVGTTATEYELYKESQIVTANSDGTVEGLTSISPFMTFLSDTECVIINLNYNADTKKYIDNKFAELSEIVASN